MIYEIKPFIMYDAEDRMVPPGMPSDFPAYGRYTELGDPNIYGYDIVDENEEVVKEFRYYAEALEYMEELDAQQEQSKGIPR